MTLKTGDDMVSGQKGGFQLINRLKNAFRQAGPKTAVSGAVPGMTLSDSQDNRHHHAVSVGGSTTFFEILQAEVMVCMDNEMVYYDNEPVTMSVV